MKLSTWPRQEHGVQQEASELYLKLVQRRSRKFLTCAKAPRLEVFRKLRPHPGRLRRLLVERVELCADGALILKIQMQNVKKAAVQAHPFRTVQLLGARTLSRGGVTSAETKLILATSARDRVAWIEPAHDDGNGQSQRG